MIFGHDFQREPVQAIFKFEINNTVTKAIICFFGNHFEELQTVLFEVELIINKPLTYVYPNTTETCFTPNHLLFGKQLLYCFRAFLKKVRHLM